MDRVQRSGVITLVLLLFVAAAGLIIGPRTTDGEDTPKHGAVVDTDLAANLVPPARRTSVITPRSFRMEPIENPAKRDGGRDILEPVPEPPEGAVAYELEVPLLDSSGAPERHEPAGVFRTVRVREGENFTSIAKRELGSAARASELMAYNGITDPRSLRIGQTLRIPEGEASAPSQGQPAPASAMRPRTYTVQPGETPGGIAKKLYGSSKFWRGLLAANGIDDPKRLRPGTVLEVPDLE